MKRAGSQRDPSKDDLGKQSSKTVQCQQHGRRSMACYVLKISLREILLREVTLNFMKSVI